MVYNSPGLNSPLSDRWTEHKDATVPDYVLGQYVINDPAGIRSHPYSTSASVVLTYVGILLAD